MILKIQKNRTTLVIGIFDFCGNLMKITFLETHVKKKQAIYSFQLSKLRLLSRHNVSI